MPKYVYDKMHGYSVTTYRYQTGTYDVHTSLRRYVLYNLYHPPPQKGEGGERETSTGVASVYTQISRPQLSGANVAATSYIRKATMLVLLMRNSIQSWGKLKQHNVHTMSPEIRILAHKLLRTNGSRTGNILRLFSTIK